MNKIREIRRDFSAFAANGMTFVARGAIAEEQLAAALPIATSNFGNHARRRLERIAFVGLCPWQKDAPEKQRARTAVFRGVPTDIESSVWASRDGQFDREPFIAG